MPRCRFVMTLCRKIRTSALAATICGLAAAEGAPARGDDPIDFGRQIGPILSDTCFRCHGADASKRKAKLRLDQRESWFAKRDDHQVIVPGNPAESELFRRITHEDPEERMPPEESVRRLSEEEIALIRKWIKQGAESKSHWAFLPPRRPALPEVRDETWPLRALDRFILARLDQAGLRPSPAIDPARLLRRLTLDLTGLPPTLEELDAFLADQGPNAYEKAVDRLLASKRYGEHMAAGWLDLARYADTDGYQDDEPRTMWRWREWLIDVLNDNLPFDQFTIQQLAGDLLPDATPEQRLATGFLRNNRVNGEGGSIAEEFRVEYIIDRVETVSFVWMGLTTGCARCHDHKYDPISQREFYSLFAFFNQIPEPGTYRRNAPPSIKVPSRRVQELERKLAGLKEESPRHRELTEARKKLLDSTPETMIMADTESRETFVLGRGQYDQRGEKVTPGVPASLPAMAEESPRNRLGLARWLVDPAHPLTARVTANRIWQHHFGTGLVKSAEDFGIQGDRPSHPDLLDWLATELVRLKWDLKAFQRLIVTSATYRQSSRRGPESRRLDPNNRLLSGGPHGRLPAEVIRDQALFVSGLLVERIGGPSVKPYQPAKMWTEIAGPTTDAYKNGYIQDTGENLYRRTIYTFWRRAIPPPGLQIFDAAGREVCQARRERTNTPLQALALMNDVTYVEAARALATRLIREGGSTHAERAAFGFRLATSRRPTPPELAILTRALERHLATYRENPDAAGKLIAVGESKPDPEIEAAELAAHTALANTLLNLDETITKP